MDTSIKITVAEDHKLVRAFYKTTIAEFPEFSIIDVAEDGKILLDLLEVKTPDIILLDFEMPEIDGVEALKIISKKYPGIKILIISSHVNEILVAHCIHLGAHGYLTKNIDEGDLIHALRSLVKDGFFFDSTVAKVFLSEVMKDRNSTFSLNVMLLSNIEKEITNLICNELTSKEIAEKLGLSENTVEFHRKNIYKKVNCKSIVGVVKYAIYHGIGGF